jgi:hypothetical protein
MSRTARIALARLSRSFDVVPPSGLGICLGRPHPYNECNTWQAVGSISAKDRNSQPSPALDTAALAASIPEKSDITRNVSSPQSNELKRVKMRSTTEKVNLREMDKAI